jgi:uncharacterized protein (DUF1778 family)
MSNKPSIDFDTGGDEAGFEEDYLQEHTDRSRVKFNTRLRADLYEKLRAAAFWTDRSITDLVEAAVRKQIRVLEKEQGEPFEVLEPHRVDDS